MPLRANFTSSCRVQLADWMMPPSICWTSPSGLMISPASAADQARVTAHASARAIDLDVGDDRAVAGEVLVFREADAAAFRKITLLAGLPAGHFGDLLDHGLRARVLRCVRRNATGSAPAASASSSMKDSGREHVGVGAQWSQADTRIGMSARMCTTLVAYANVFASESFMDELALAAAPIGRVSSHAPEGPAREGRDREGRRNGRLEDRREG